MKVAWLERAGATVTCLDLAVQSLEAEAITAVDLVAFYVPMHTQQGVSPR